MPKHKKPGRKKLSDADARRIRTSVMLNPDESKRLAKMGGSNVSEFIRRRIFAEA